jgi:hypothetical protein
LDELAKQGPSGGQSTLPPGNVIASDHEFAYRVDNSLKRVSPCNEPAATTIVEYTQALAIPIGFPRLDLADR